MHKSSLEDSWKSELDNPASHQTRGTSFEQMSDIYHMKTSFLSFEAAFAINTKSSSHNFHTSHELLTRKTVITKHANQSFEIPQTAHPIDYYFGNIQMYSKAHGSLPMDKL